MFYIYLHADSFVVSNKKLCYAGKQQTIYSGKYIESVYSLKE